MAGDDLKKMMSKLKKEKTEKVAETPTEDVDVETETPTEDVDVETETPTEDVDVETETPTEDPKTETPKEEITEEKTELKEVEDQGDVEGELAVLQNDGIFRRELLLTLRELVDVHKVNTQTLLDLKNRLEDADGKKE